MEWQDRKLNFIDCPGSDDFIGGAVSALNVTDTALMVLNAQYGVEVGTITNSVIPNNSISRLSLLSISWIMIKPIMTEQLPSCKTVGEARLFLSNIR